LESARVALRQRQLQAVVVRATILHLQVDDPDPVGRKLAARVGVGGGGAGNGGDCRVQRNREAAVARPRSDVGGACEQPLRHLALERQVVVIGDRRPVFLVERFDQDRRRKRRRGGANGLVGD